MRISEIDDRLARAEAQGYTVDAYHGTDRSFGAFKHQKGAHFGFHFGSTPLAAPERLNKLRTHHGTRDRRDAEPVYDPVSREAAIQKLRQQHAVLTKALSAIETEITGRRQFADHDEIAKALESGDEAELTRLLAIGQPTPTATETEQIAKLRAALDEVEQSMSNRFAQVISGEQIIPVKLRLRNPLRMNDTNWGDPARIAADNRSLRLPDSSLAAIRAAIEQRGFDGVVYKNEVEAAGSDSYIVFKPAQIRSRFANFNPAKSDSGRMIEHVPIVAR